MLAVAAFVALLLNLQHFSSSLKHEWTATNSVGCVVCSCRRSSWTIDCSSRKIGRLPDPDGFPHIGVTSFLFADNSVEHVPFGYFLAFPNLELIEGERNLITEPFLLPETIVKLDLSHNHLTSAFTFFNRSVAYKMLADFDIHDNNITRLHSGEFSDLPNLIYLNLGGMHTGISQIGPLSIRSLPKLKRL
jgi:Leucine-rich repeat (LRR) protein